ncbi:hypothetical protein [Flavisphingomonas formosensis]|uniref:hypothetical protein n=1 Tax=Flavisphingomonas formosensis TaxID=861534 RepID=UPI0012FB669B|nr:hypothetical protein [Sphingomonas formosensis]
MKLLDLWLVGFGLRCCALLLCEVGSLLFVIPTLFNLHSDLADAGAAILAIVAIGGGFLWGSALSRELITLLADDKNE